MVGVTDDENVFAIDMVGLGVDLDRGKFRERNRRGPVRHRGPVGEQHRTSPIPMPVGADQDRTVGASIYLLDPFAVADVELIVPNQLGEGDGVAAGDQANGLDARTLRGDRDTEPAGGAAGDHEVVHEVVVEFGHAHECGRRIGPPAKGGPETMLLSVALASGVRPARHRRSVERAEQFSEGDETAIARRRVVHRQPHTVLRAALLR